MENYKNEINSTNNAVEDFYKKHREKKEREKKEQETMHSIDEMVKDMDRQMLEDTIFDWERKPEMKPYLDYLRRKRLIIKSK